VNGEPATIVGVMPDKFLFPENQQLWVPLKPDPLKFERGRGPTSEVFGRLRAGVTIDDAMSELTTISKRLEAEHPATNKDLRPVIKPFTEEYIGDEPRVLLFTMLGAVFFVLLIACTNVANLLLGRAILRSKEVGIRTALGANRWRLITQFLTEALVLSLVGAALGVALGWIGIRLFNNSIASTQPPFWIDIRLDGVALLFVLALTILTALISGTIPALQASRRDVTDVLKDESRGASSFRLGRISRALVIFEMALSCGLLVAAGLTIKSVVKLRNVDLGFPTDHLFTTRVVLDEKNYADSIKVVQFYDKVVQGVAQIPDVETVTVATSLPGLGEGNWSFGIEGTAYERDQDYPTAPRAAVMPNYFATLGIKALEGRLLTDADRIDAMPVAVVNKSFVSRYFNGQSPLGRRIRFGVSTSKAPWVTIVGVVNDAQLGDLEPPRRHDAIYVPFAQNSQRFMNVIARTRGEPMAISAAVRNLVTSIDADIPIYFTDTLMGRIAQETWFYRVFGVLFMVFGFAALLLASIGLYAVMAFSVSQRTREVGIRMAIGAQARDVLAMILRQGLLQVGIGMLLGLAIAAGVGHLLTIILFDVQPRDPFVFGSIILVLTLTAVAACLVPARRATAVDPLEALRYE
jgi:putative ABC transport system permease protein